MKQLLSQKGVVFEERNVSRNRTYVDELRRMGFAAVPITVVGERKVAGFDKSKLEAALGV